MKYTEKQENVIHMICDNLNLDLTKTMEDIHTKEDARKFIGENINKSKEKSHSSSSTVACEFGNGFAGLNSVLNGMEYKYMGDSLF